MWFRKIVMRKTQFFIIMLLTMMAAMILTACVSFTLETQRFVESYYSADNCPMAFTVSAREDCEELIENDEVASSVITKMQKRNAKYLTDAFYCEGEKIPNEGSFAYAIEDIDKVDYAISVMDGEEKKAPEDGEVWITNICAKAYDMKVGDSFKIGTGKTYKISAIVNSAICSSGFIDNYPYYFNDRTLEEIDGTDGYALDLYVDDTDISLKEFQEILPDEFTAAKMFMIDRATLKMCLSILTGIFGGVGVVAALIILAVSVIVFRYLVRATIAKEYQMIGIYKALGRDNDEIKKIYLSAYMVSGVIGMIPGMFLARPLADYLGKVVLGGNKAFVLTEYTTFIGMAAVVFICVVLWLNVSGELKKIRTISPIQAMNLQMLSSEEKLSKSLIPSAASSVSMAINGMWKRKGMSLLIIMILTVSVYIDVMAGEVALTLANYAEDRTIWENLPEYDCMIKTMGNEDALSYIQNSDDVVDYVQLELDPECSGMEIEGTEWSSEEAHPMIYDNFTEERYETVPFTKGRICLERHEIAASEQFLSEVDKKVGDYIKVSNGDKQIRCLIVGSYSAMMKGGASFYLLDEDFEELGYHVDYQTILVFLKDGIDYDTFAAEFEKAVPGSLMFTDFNFVEREGDTVGEIANPICVVLFAAFAAFSILNIVNLIHTQIKENRRKYGIQKAMGFTTGYIIRESLVSLTIQYAIAMIITVILNEILSPILFSLACGVFYIRKPFWLPATVGGVTYVVLMLIALVMLQSIRKIKPVELMEE
ncbi:MAG: hypothetical protein PUD20_02615 [bacterium]|nr:hypothetical protein [bacterium]